MRFCWMHFAPLKTDRLLRAAAVLALLLTVGGAPPLFGQMPSETVTVQGTVLSQGGEPLDAAQVTFRPGDLATTTNPEGAFELRFPPGTAGTLTIAHSGHFAEMRAVAAAPAGALRRIAVTLVPVYDVDALTVVTHRQRPLLNTQDAETGGSIEPWEMRALPTEAREPLSLAFNVPGVSQATGFFGDAPPLTIHGDNAIYTQYTVDGLDNNEGFLGGPRVQLPLVGIERLTVHAAAYRPAFGRTTNGVVDLETRAGGGAWSGDVFLVNRPGTPIDASPKFAPAGVDPDGFKRSQLGAAFGGPIVSDRTFVFGALEYTSEQEDRIGSTARTSFLGSEERDTWKAFARLDHGWSPTQTTTIRAALSDERRKGQGGGVIVPEADITTRRIGSLTNATHRTSLRGGRASNELSIQVGTFIWDFPPSASDLSTPQVEIRSPDGVTQAVVGSSNFIFDESELQFQLKELFETRLGDAHTLRAGVDVVHSSFELLGANTNPQGAYVVIDEGDIDAAGAFLSITDIPDDVRVFSYTIDANPQQVDLTHTLWSAFVEDRWRVGTSLTIQAGLRWDYDDITSRGESDPDLNNFQPRTSFNWFATPESVVRGGWGLHTGTFPYAVYSDAVQFGEHGNAVVTFTEGTDFPPPAFGEGPSAADVQALEGDLPPREVRRTFARGLEQPWSSQTSLGYQRRFGELWSVSVDGVWVETRNLPRSWDMNAITRPLEAGDTVARSPEFGDASRGVEPVPGGFRRLTTTDSGGKARYLGLHTTLRRLLADGFGIEAAWVWSKSQNDTEDINFHATQGNDFAAEWAAGVNDRRHHVTARTVWAPIEGMELATIVDWQSGTPINRIAFQRDLDGSGAIFGNGFLGNHDRFPGVARNGERLPDAWQINMSAAYDLPVGAGSLGLRAEAFNVLNRTNLTGFANGIPGGGPRTQTGRPGDPLVVTTAAPPRQFQFSARWRF